MSRFLALALAALLALPASAQDSAVVDVTEAAQSGFRYAGTLALSATDMMNGQAIGLVDVTFSLPLSQRVPLRFEAGTYLFALDGKRPHETYGALVWNDRLRAGALRPAYDAVLPSVFEDTAPYLAYQRAEYARSHNTVEAMRRTAVPWGLSYAGSAGRLDWVVSAHDAVKGTFRSTSAAVTYTGEGWAVMAAVESVWSRDNAHDGVNAKIGARFDIGPAALELALLHPDANSRPDALAVDLRVPLSSRTGLSVMGEFTEDGSDDAYGLAADVRLGKGSRLVLAATDGAAGAAAHLTCVTRF
jgi:hypothetical protein